MRNLRFHGSHTFGEVEKDTRDIVLSSLKSLQVLNHRIDRFIGHVDTMPFAKRLHKPERRTAPQLSQTLTSPKSAGAHHALMACSQPSLFKARLREACEAKGMTLDKLMGSIGIGPKKVIAIEVAGLRELDIHRLLQIADRLDVSLDWLMGRSEQRQIQP
jgi:hypothetical protein